LNDIEEQLLAVGAQEQNEIKNVMIFSIWQQKQFF